MTATDTKISAAKPVTPSRATTPKNRAKPALPKKAAAKAPSTAAKKSKSQTSPAPQVAPKPAKEVAPAKPVKSTKVKKPKMVRDSFTMPKLEFAVLDLLKLRAAKLSTPIKKTELIRAGIKALAAMPDAAFLTAIKAVPSLKTGRPAKS